MEANHYRLYAINEAFDCSFGVPHMPRHKSNEVSTVIAIIDFGLFISTPSMCVAFN